MPNTNKPLDPNNDPNLSSTSPLKEELQSEIDSLEKAMMDKLSPEDRKKVENAERKFQPMEEKIVDAIEKSGMGAVALGVLKKVKTALQQKLNTSTPTRENKDPFDVTPRERDDNEPPKHR
jgi:hypothetical protein